MTLFLHLISTILHMKKFNPYRKFNYNIREWRVLYPKLIFNNKYKSRYPLKLSDVLRCMKNEKKSVSRNRAFK